MQRFIDVPLYTYRISCEGGHIYIACLPEIDPKEALELLASEMITSWLYVDQHSKVRDVSIFSAKIVGLDEVSKDPKVITNKAGKLEASAYKSKKEEKIPVGRIARKGHKRND